MASTEQRYGYLDGLRGIGALQVFALHASIALFAATGPYGLNLMLVDGQLAVFLFFCISGFVLTGVYENRQSQLWRLCAARATRLFVPTLFACLFAALLRFAFNVKGVQGSPVEFAGQVLDFTMRTITIGHTDSSLLRHVPGVDDFLHRQSSNINSALWTIHVEFVGSLLILALSRLPRGWYRAVAIAICAALAFRSLLFPFLAGSILYYWQPTVRSGLVTLGLFIAAIIISIAASNSSYFGWALTITSFDWIIPAQSAYSVQKSFAATLLFLAVVASRPLQESLSTRGMAVLGRYSFPIYLTHVPILATIGRPLRTSWLLSALPPLAASIGALLACIAATILASIVFLRIDQMAIRWGRSILKPAPPSPGRSIVESLGTKQET